MTLKIKRVCENYGARICLSGELRLPHLVALRAELEQIGQSLTLDLTEVGIVDIDGIRL
jgi:hypothetical protein